MANPNRFFYLGTEHVNRQTGIGAVMRQEVAALAGLGGVQLFVQVLQEGPLEQDAQMLHMVQNCVEQQQTSPLLAHTFHGYFERTMAYLKSLGCKLTLTSSGRDQDLAKAESDKLGWTPKGIWAGHPELEKIVARVHGLADVVICPSRVASKQAERVAYRKVVCIPHGCWQAGVKPLPPSFVVGFLGHPVPERGLLYLFQAWCLLDYTDANLVLAGQGITGLPVWHLLRPYDRRQTVILDEWTKDTDSFYNSISLYVQPSVTESFGLPVLEAMAHGRAVLCSTGAGAAELLPDAWTFPAGDPRALAEKIDRFRQMDLQLQGLVGRGLAQKHEWPAIREKYQQVWKQLL